VNVLGTMQCEFMLTVITCIIQTETAEPLVYKEERTYTLCPEKRPPWHFRL